MRCQRVRWIPAVYGAGVSPVSRAHSRRKSSMKRWRSAAIDFAGLTGNQIATYIVNHTGEFIDIDGNSVNPQGYQNVLYFTVVMYIIALILCFTLVRPSGKAAAELEAKKGKS